MEEDLAAGARAEHRGFGGARAGASAVQRRARRSDEALVYAALDLGTNNCRLLVAVPDRVGFRVIDAFSRIVRLGEGLFSSGYLSQDAQERALAALRSCREKLDRNGVTRGRFIATEACRQAANGPDFLARVREETAIELEIIDRGTEARLAVHGCAQLLDPNAGSALLFDIGGGSTELVFLTDIDTGGPAIEAWTSLPIGVVTLAERHGGREVSPESFAAMVEDVARLIDAFPARERIARAARAPDFHLLGTSGTVTTVAGLHLDLRRYERSRVDGLWMSADNVSDVIGTLLETSYAERVVSPCIGPDRADLVLAGCAILEAIRDAFPAARLRVADRGLREGILIELMGADGTLGREHPRSRRARAGRRIGASAWP